MSLTDALLTAILVMHVLFFWQTSQWVRRWRRRVKGWFIRG